MSEERFSVFLVDDESHVLRPGTIVNSAPSQCELEARLVMDRLLRECFTRKSPREWRGTEEISCTFR
jgi:hypothetical protein